MSGRALALGCLALALLPGGDADRLPASNSAEAGSGGGSLPFTGFLLVAPLVLGLSLAGLGLALRRRAKTG